MSIFKRAYKSFMQGPIFVILFGLAFFGIGAGLSYKQFNLQLNGEQAQGQVVGLSEQCDDEGCAYAPVVSFQTRDGSTVYYRSNYHSSPPAYDVGEQVNVIYDPANPNTAQINKWTERWLFPIIIVPVMIIVALIMNFFMIRSFIRNDPVYG